MVLVFVRLLLLLLLRLTLLLVVVVVVVVVVLVVVVVVVIMVVVLGERGVNLFYFKGWPVRPFSNQILRVLFFIWILVSFKIFY